MDKFSRRWIVENGVEVVRSYGHGLTLRVLHYQLVARGMTNDLAHYNGWRPRRPRRPRNSGR
jgi:hypothetical protein